jgi:hypothetical protein
LKGGELGIGVLKFIDIAQAIGFDPASAIRSLARIDEA